ncbi:hypothetical protein GCM10020218_018180 [Dactylosporangium vinaceum]
MLGGSNPNTDKHDQTDFNYYDEDLNGLHPVIRKPGGLITQAAIPGGSLCTIIGMSVRQSVRRAPLRKVAAAEVQTIMLGPNTTVLVGPAPVSVDQKRPKATASRALAQLWPG